MTKVIYGSEYLSAEFIIAVVLTTLGVLRG